MMGDIWKHQSRYYWHYCYHAIYFSLWKLRTNMGYVNSIARNMASASCRQNGNEASCPCCTRLSVAVARSVALVLDLQSCIHAVYTTHQSTNCWCMFPTQYHQTCREVGWGRQHQHLVTAMKLQSLTEACASSTEVLSIISKRSSGVRPCGMAWRENGRVCWWWGVKSIDPNQRL